MPIDAPSVELLSADALRADALWGCELAGTYRIERTIGGGAVSKVYEASHARLDRRFAIKVMREQHAGSTIATQRFLREARLLGQLHSPYLLQVFDVLTLPDGRPCIVSELLHGEDLQAKLHREHQLPPQLAMAIVRQACMGLQIAHAQGVVHRDLKPSNLFLVQDEDPQLGLQVKVVDFGVAKLLGDGLATLTESGALLGTPAYMPPEQAYDPSLADPRSDVYALGGVLYRAVTGRAPYVGSDPRTTISRLLQSDPPRPRTINPSVPAEVEAIIQRAMARPLEARYPDVMALRADLETTLRPQEAPAYRPQPDSRTMRRAQRARPQALAWMAALLLLSAASLAAWLRSLSDGWREANGPASSTERWLMTLGVLVASAVFAFHLVQRLRQRWTSAPATEHLGQACRSAALTLGFAFGSVLLLRLGFAACRQANSIGLPLVGMHWALLGAGLSAGWMLWRHLGKRPGVPHARSRQASPAPGALPLRR